MTTIFNRVEDQLPSHTNNVLVMSEETNGNKTFAVAYYDGFIWCVDCSVFDEYNIHLVIEVTHWSELPNEVKVTWTKGE